MCEPISTKLLQIEVRNKKLKDLQLIEFESLGSEIKLTFEYDKEFADKYNLQWSMNFKFKRPIIIIEHNFSDWRTPRPFGIEIIEDYENNKIYIDER